MKTYSDLVKEVESKGCKLNWDENDFETKYKNFKSMIDIISTCGHESCVQHSNFIYKNTGVVCKKCVINRTSVTMTARLIDNNEQEYRVIHAFKTFCQNEIDFMICDDGTLADFAFRPSNFVDDIWLPVQVKTTNHQSHGIYKFHMNNKYKDIYLLLFSIEDQRIWLIDGNNVDVDKTSISIGQYNSMFSKYEICANDLCFELRKIYSKKSEYIKSFEQINTPITEYCAREREFRAMRAEIFKNIQFTYPKIDNRVYDVVLNNCFKVQDKVICEFFQNKTNKPNEKRAKPSWVVNMDRQKRNKYKKGDNHFYWLFLPDKKGAYVLPETVLIEHNIISSSEKQSTEKINQLILYPYDAHAVHRKTGWCNEYLYFFDKDISRIEELFKQNDQPEIILDEIINPIIIQMK